MRKILSFLMMTLFSVSMFAAEPVTVKSTFTKATKPADNKVTDLEGKVTWSIATEIGQGEPTYATGAASSVEAIKFGSSKSVYFKKIKFSTDYFKDYNVKSVSLYVKNNGAKVGTLTAKQGEVTIGSKANESATSDWNVMTASGNTGNGGTVEVTYEVEQASYISYIEVTYEAGGGDPEPTTKTIYLNTGGSSLWNQANAVFFEHSWGAEDSDLKLTQVEGDLYKAEIPVGNSSILFVRMPAGSESIIWDGDGKYWNKTGDLTIPNDKNLYTITGWGENDGAWSTYSPSEPPTPAEKDSIFFVNVPGWDNLRVHLWGGTAAGTTWPGVEMTKVSSDGEGAPAVARGAKLSDDGKINGYDVYKYVADKGAYKNCIFSNNGANQTDDLDWTSGSYFYDGAWYATEDAIPEPIPAAVPLEGNIWKVTAETPVRAGSHYIDEALLKMDGVYATTLKPNTRTIAGEDFTHAIQVRTDGYPTQDVLAGKEKTGSTSLIITAKENADITLYYNRQAIDASGTENDNKDLIVFDQAAITTKVTGEFKVVEVLEGNSYLNATKKIALKKDHVYTVTASGTTIQLHGIKLEEHIPAMQIAGGWDVKDEAWVVNNMTLAGDAKTATYEVELTKGDYEFKVLKDGAWLTKANDGAYGLHREWPGVAGVTDDAVNNLKVTADAAGKYIFTWTFANDSIGITFPAPEPTKYFLKNNWNGAEEWTWKEMTEEDGSYILAEVVFGGNGVNINKAESDEGATWIDAEDILTFDAEYELATLGALDTVVFIFDPEAVNTYTGENGLSAIILGKYVAPAAAKFYITGNAALVGDELEWNPAAIKSMEDSYTLNLKAGVDYMLKLTLNGTWDGENNVKGYDALTTVADGLIRGEGSDNDNICFKLAEDGDVTVTYKVEADVVTFKLEGNFAVSEPQLTDGFYLIGQNGWGVAALNADLLFTANPENEGEYQLAVTLVKDQSIKVVKVESDVITAWYPEGMDNDYKVDEAHAGDKTVYFRPDQQGGEGWHYGCIYIAPNEATGIANTAVDAKAVKVINNGQLFIIRNGKTYTVQGLLVR